MKIVWVPLCIALIIASVDAQRSFNVSKPVVSPEKRPRPMTWLRRPEERRKLSIFPKKDMKFVATPTTAVENDETESTSVGLPTKRPLMRKFIIHDRNEKNSWYFAPREPLMKTNRFTVTMSPPKQTEMRDSKYSNQKPKREMAAESKKVNTVLSNSNARQGLNKVQTNKGNLINASRNKNVNVPPSKSFGRINKLNDKEAKNNQRHLTIVNNSSLISRDHDYETRTNNAKTEVNSTDLIKTENVHESSTVSKLLMSSNIEEIISDTMDSRSSDLSDTVLVGQKEDRALNLDVEKSKGNLDGSSNIKLLKILMDNIMNDTATLNDDVSLSAHMDNSTIKSNQSNTHIMEDIPQELHIETNKINHVTPFSNANVSNAEVLVGNEDINTSGKNRLINKKQDNYVPSYLHILKTPVKTADIPFQSNQNDSCSENNHGNIENYTEHQGSTTPFVIATRAVETDLTELPTENFSENFENSVTENIITKSTFENIKFEDTSVGHDATFSSETLSSQVSNINELHDDFKIDELMPVTEVSYLLFSLSGETKKDVSNESLYDKSSNLTNQHDSNESYLIGEETSSESVSDKSNNYTDEVSDEMEINHNLSAEEVSKDSNMATEEISNESISNKSNNLTEEVSNESMIDQSTNYTDEESNVEKVNNLTGEEISNESNIGGEEISNESFEKISEEILNSESVIDISLTVEDLSEEIVKDISKSFKSQPSLNSENILTNRFKRNSNVIEEEMKATTISGFKYTGHEVRLGHSLNYKNINA